jgi:excisionase family DNA binding protein
VVSAREVSVDPERLFTVDELAERLHVHPQTVRTWIRNRDIGNVTIGRFRYVSAPQLAKFIAEHSNDVD